MRCLAQRNRSIPSHLSGEFGRERVHYNTSQQVGWSSSDPVTKSPFGNLPFAIAGGNRRGFSGPLSQGFGFGGGGEKYDQFQRELGRAEGPTAEFIRQGQSFLPTLFGSAQGVGSQIAGQGQQSFDAFQSSINQFMQQLPNFQAAMAQGQQGLQQGLGYAQQNAEQAFSPIQSQALYQQAAGNALDPARQASAARGLLDSGAAQQSENDMLTNLASQFAQQQQANQYNATQGLLGAGGAVQQGAGQGAALASMGPQMQEAIFAAIPQLSQLLQSGYQLPMDALNQFGSFLAAQQNPSMSLLGATSPVVGQSSSSFQGGGSAGIS